MADPATQFQSAGIVSPTYQPVVTRLNPPIDLPYISRWKGVSDAIKSATDTIMKSRLNPYVRAQQDAEIARNRVQQDFWKRKLAEGAAGYSTEKTSGEGIETYGVDTSTGGDVKHYDTSRKQTQTQPPNQTQTTTTDQNLDEGGKLSNLVKQKWGDHDSTVTSQKNSDGSYTFSDQNGHVVHTLSQQDAQTLLDANSDSTSKKTSTSTSTNTPGQHSGYTYAPGPNDYATV